MVVKKLGFFFLIKFISSLSPSNLKGKIMTLWIFALGARSLTCTLKIAKYSMESCTTVILSLGKKTSPNLDILVEIYGLQTRKVTRGYMDTHWVAHGGPSQRKEFQSLKIFYMLRVRLLYMLFWPPR